MANSFAKPRSRPEYSQRTPCSRCYTAQTHPKFHIFIEFLYTCTIWYRCQLSQVKPILSLYLTLLHEICVGKIIFDEIENYKPDPMQCDNVGLDDLG